MDEVITVSQPWASWRQDLHIGSHKLTPPLFRKTSFWKASPSETLGSPATPDHRKGQGSKPRGLAPFYTPSATTLIRTHLSYSSSDGIDARFRSAGTPDSRPQGEDTARVILQGSCLFLAAADSAVGPCVAYAHAHYLSMMTAALLVVQPLFLPPKAFRVCTPFPSPDTTRGLGRLKSCHHVASTPPLSWRIQRWIDVWLRRTAVLRPYSHEK